MTVDKRYKNVPGTLGSSSLKWTNRFIGSAILQGAIIVVFTLFLVFSQISFLTPEISRVIAGGGAGTWFTFGYILYIIVGVIGIAVSALFYYYLEGLRNRPLDKIISKIFAWIHLLFMNIGTTVTMGLLMYTGYVGGASMLSEDIGGKGFDAGQAHQIMSPFVEPIGAGIVLLCVGIIMGGIGFMVTYLSKERNKQ